MGHLPPERKWKGFEYFSDEDLKNLIQTGAKAQAELNYRQELKKWEKAEAERQGWHTFWFCVAGIAVVMVLAIMTM